MYIVIIVNLSCVILDFARVPLSDRKQQVRKCLPAGRKPSKQVPDRLTVRQQCQPATTSACKPVPPVPGMSGLSKPAGHIQQTEPPQCWDELSNEAGRFNNYSGTQIVFICIFVVREPIKLIDRS